jgi:hypothetical protein
VYRRCRKWADHFIGDVGIGVGNKRPEGMLQCVLWFPFPRRNRASGSCRPRRPGYKVHDFPSRCPAMRWRHYPGSNTRYPAPRHSQWSPEMGSADGSSHPGKKIKAVGTNPLFSPEIDIFGIPRKIGSLESGNRHKSGIGQRRQFPDR